LSDRGVQASGDRIFLQAPQAVTEDRPELERALGADGVRADDADVQALARRRRRLEREHGLGAVENHDDPPGAVIGPLGIYDVGAINAQHRSNPVDECALDGPAAEQRRRGEAERAVGAADPYETDPALLDDLVVAPSRTPGGQPRMAAAQRRMPGERELVRKSEDPHPVVGVRRGRRQEERRLRQVHPPGELLHLLRRQALGIEHDGKWVAGEWVGREHVDLLEPAQHQPIVADTVGAVLRQQGVSG
jgi:hypothetical protein